MKLTITTLVIVEGSYFQGMENSLEIQVKLTKNW